MPAPDFPGFVYDENRKKYFKIHPNHANPGASRYSKDAVKRHAEEKAVSGLLSVLLRGGTQSTTGLFTSYPLGSQVSSLTLSATHQVLLATTIGGFSPGEMLFKWFDGSDRESHFVLTRGGPLWCSACRPQVLTGSLGFAVGSRQHLSLSIVEPQGKIHPFLQRPAAESAQDDVRAVDWLDTNVVMGGLRNGRVFFYDLRFPSLTPSISTAATLTDTSTSHHPVWKSQTKPYLTFPTYHNAGHNGQAIGFDVAPPLNLIAAATDRREVQLFHEKTGLEVQLGDGEGHMRRKKEELPGVANCVKFVDVEGGKEKVPRLVATADGVLVEWKC
ncbi:MAG: hypothetical protein Q9163_002024 [Psora crenata]